MGISLSQLLESQIPEYSREIVLPDIASERTIVVLDDDPTGCQTLHNVPVLFSYENALLKTLFLEKSSLFFILTNTRSMSQKEAVSVIGDVMKNLISAAAETGREFQVVSRGDSTLRGHYPAELYAIEKYLPGEDYMHCLVPAFFPGGRFTCNDIHYVMEGETLIPAADTPFASDKVFGYSHSDLKEYISEKTDGIIRPDQVLSISIEDIRDCGPEYVTYKLLNSDCPVCIVNALLQSDLDVFSSGVWHAIQRGKRILFRTGASFLNSFSGIRQKDPLPGEELRRKTVEGGLIIAGSHVPTTSKQLQPLMKTQGIFPMELHVKKVLSESYKEVVSSISTQAGLMISEGKDVLIYTSRELVHTKSIKKDIEIGKTVSNAITEIVLSLHSDPSFIVAKGGITAHNIAAKGLRMKRATVQGQALPGVPVLVTDDRPGFRYIIFPGNVGDDDALLELYKLLNTEI